MSKPIVIDWCLGKPITIEGGRPIGIGGVPEDIKGSEI